MMNRMTKILGDISISDSLTNIAATLAIVGVVGGFFWRTERRISEQAKDIQAIQKKLAEIDDDYKSVRKSLHEIRNFMNAMNITVNLLYQEVTGKGQAPPRPKEQED